MKKGARGQESRGEPITVMWTWLTERAEGTETGKQFPELSQENVEGTW